MRKMYIGVAVMLCLFSALPSFAYDLVVAKDGTGNFTTIQAAIDAAPTNGSTAFTIYIKNGEYYEKVIVPSNKPFITMIGESTEGVILTYDDYASKPLPGGGTVGTMNSGSLMIHATDFTAVNMTFVNSYGIGSQAVAVTVNNDRVVFKNCRFLGNQDTIYLRGGGAPRHYLNNCYIDGNVDYIFGNAIAVFDSCAIYSKARSASGSSFLTAANTPAGQAYGFVFRDCMLTDHTGSTLYYLGRPWQNATGSSPRSNPKTVFINSRMGAKIRPEGWTIWDAGTDTDLNTYAEYNSRCFNGATLDISQRVSWSKQLNATEAADYTLANMFGAWDPCAAYTGICNTLPYRPWVNNFIGVKGNVNSTFSWNIAWPKAGVQFELFKATSPAGPFVSEGTTISPNDSLVDFSLTSPIPPSGSTYYYLVSASFSGVNTVFSDTVKITSAPTIKATATMPAFYQTIGAPSATSSYTVLGTDLQGDITVTPPENFEVSADNGTTWKSHSTPLVLTQSGGVVESKTLLVRLNATVSGDYSGSIVHSSTAAETVLVNVSGKALDAPPHPSNVLMHFPLSASAADDAAKRSPALRPATFTGNNLYLSNGTTVPTIPAFSGQYGMAFGATSNGDGSWGTALGGPGGNLNRIYYQEFSVQSDGLPVRLDSLVLYSAFYNTSSNTKLGIKYSFSNFVSDSADVSGGTGPAGNAVTATFDAPIVLANQNTGANQYYRIALNGEDGVTLPAYGTITFRFYFSCGSSSAGRYGLMKEVDLKGEATAPVAPSAVLMRFPLDANASDNGAERSPAVMPSTITGKNLYVSNGTTVPTIPSFSGQYGMAFGASPNGDGSWGTGIGGPGGNLNYNHYREVTVETNGNLVWLDSLIVSAAFYNTSSNTKMAVVYSYSDFASDSAAITGGTGPANSPVVGSFASPIVLANQTSGPTNTYRLALNNANGLVLPAGGKLTIRFYFSCGSSSPGRYAMVKDLQVKGQGLGTLPLTLVNFSGVLKDGNAVLSWVTNNEQQMRNFEVEHSTDAARFEKVGMVNARNLASRQSYSFTHLPGQKGWNYYRLKMVNTDGTFRYSKTVALSVAAENMVTVYPNPAMENLQVKSAFPVRNLRVVDLSGRVLMQQNYGAGQRNISLNLSALPGGNYILIGATDGEPLIYRFIKTNKR